MADRAEMVLYCGFLRETVVPVSAEYLAAGAGRIACIECGGDGDWTKFHPEPETGPHPCVVCKGTGLILVSV